jgi:outer membrane protein OmpA-like peptidoglycan-associated protein/tetratricopeptide (TPR) repeat protein
MRSLKTILLLLILFAGLTSRSQVRNNEFVEAEELLVQGKYASALNLYLQVLKTFPNSGIVNYKIGYCYLHSRSQAARAPMYFERAIEYSTLSAQSEHAKESDAPRDVYKLLGDACFTSYKFEQAATAYEKYLEILSAEKNNDQALLESLANKIETCRFARELKELSSSKIPDAAPEKLSDIILSKNIQSPGDYTSTISPDKNSMILSFKVPVVNYRKKPEDFRYFEEIEIPATLKNTFMNRQKNTDSVEYATTIGTAVDGQAILTYSNNSGKAGLYISFLKHNSWTEPRALSESPNMKGWEPNEYLSPDGNILYFVCERNGGFGGKDIYYCTRENNGSWSKARNAGPAVNSPFDETAPFMHPGGSLVFSSNRNSQASFEVFSSQLSDSGLWREPVNVGYPAEKKNNEKIIVATASNQLLKAQTETKKISATDLKGKETDSLKRDYYLVTFISPERKSLTVLSGKIRSKQNEPPPKTLITLIDNSTESVQAVYHPDSKSGEYSFILPSGKNINITYEAPGYLFQSENIAVQNDQQYFFRHAPVTLPPLAEGSKIELANVFFSESGATLLPASFTELNRLAELMRKNPQMKIEVVNSIYTKKNKRAAKKLSKARAAAIKNFLVEKGSDQKTISVKGRRYRPLALKFNERIFGVTDVQDQKVTVRIKELK